MVVELPTGTVTFVFTDIEGSTRLVQELGGRWRDVLEDHNRILRQAMEEADGTVVKTEGDAFFAVFRSAISAVEAAVRAQTEIHSHPWPEGAEIRVRIGVHTGLGVLGGDDYIGLDVHRAARIAAAAHGGQTILSEPVAVLVERDLPYEVTLRDAGKHRLKDLAHAEALFELVIEGLPSQFPPLRTLEAIPHNLPIQSTSFVGREQELKETRALLGTSRVLTITGPGGTGKTRLALQLAGDVAGDYRDGVFFIDLSPISDVEAIPSVILSTLGALDASGASTSTATLLEFLADREVLLLLDNFEQLTAAAPLVAAMVRASPHSRFLVTSRAPLRISAEQVYPLDPMAVPEAGDRESDALRLFVERATSVRPDFALDESNTAAVADLVTLLDGLPLAIELVASRVRALPVPTILARLDPTRLGEGAVDLPSRQRTIEAAISWSFDLLDDDEKKLFARMSVFAGGARLEQIEEVCGEGIDVLAALESLVDQSLVRRLQAGPEPRFRMLHVIREYAAGCLDAEETETIRRRHLEAFVQFAEMTASRLKGYERRHWLDALAAEHANVQAAFQTAIDLAEVDLACRLGFAMWRFWQARGFLHEGRRHLEMAVSLPGVSDYWRAKALEGLGGILWWRGQPEECLVAYGQALELQRSLGDSEEIANALYNHSLALGFIDMVENGEQVMAQLEEAEDRFREAGNLDGVADVAWARGNMATLAGRLEYGEAELQRSLELYEQAGNQFGLGWALFELALAARRRKDFEAAWPYLERGLRIFAEHGDISAAVMFIAVSGALAIDLGDEARGARLGGASHELRLSSGTDIITHEVNGAESVALERLEALTGELRQAYLEGRKMDFDQAVAYALTGPSTDVPRSAVGTQPDSPTSPY